MDELKRLLGEEGIETESLRLLFGEGDAAIYGVTRTGEEAIDAWFVLRECVAGRGWWPVVLGPDERVDRVGEDLEFNLEGTSPRALIEKARAIDADAWLAEQGADGAPDACEWSDEIRIAPNRTFTVATNILTQRSYPRVTIGLVPAAEPWEVPAYLGLGGWNECPSPEVHAAIMRRWHERFGAQIAGYTGDVVELHIARPVEDPDTAVALARAQYAYCPDVVDQGVGTLEALAALLVGSTVWYFWWD
jgi:uncharacterized protein DUF4253